MFVCYIDLVKTLDTYIIQMPMYDRGKDKWTMGLFASGIVKIEVPQVCSL